MDGVMTGRVGGHIVRTGGHASVTTHGMARTKIYNIWSDMVARCNRITHARYADYGGRGIAVCDRWRDFANFYADMGERPEGRSLDRINNNGSYSPENCRWATSLEQNRNKREYRPRKPRPRKTHCKQGHEFTPSNTWTSKSGFRTCLACNRDRKAAKRAEAVS